MSESDPSIEISFKGDEYSIEVPDEGVTFSSQVTQIERNLFRLDSIPFMVESLNYRDVIEVKRLDDRKLQLIRIVEPSDWVTYDFVMSEDVIDSPQIREILDKVESFGGYWEQVFGGVLLISLPSDENYNPTSEILKS